MVQDVAGTAAFYLKVLAFESTFESDWYVSLKKKGSEGIFQLAILAADHETIPDGFRRPSGGILLNVEVSNAAEIYNTLVKQNKLPLHLDLRDEEWGQRHFITADPAGNLIDVIELIKPSDEFLAKYSEGLQ